MRKSIYYIFYFLVFFLLFIGLITLNYKSIFICLLTIFFFILLDFLNRKFTFSFPLKLLIFLFLFFSLILGELFDFYNKYYYFDNILHFISGIITGCLAISILFSFLKLNSKKILNFLFPCIFIISFSLFLGIVWEFLEFNFDKYLGFDMQKDTYVDSINSVSLDTNNVLLHINEILYTDINTSKGVIRINGGYLDIGLIDTINDLVANFLGSFTIVCLYLYIFKYNKEKYLKYLIIIKK